MSASDPLRPGYYWVHFGTTPLEIGFWDGAAWWFCGSSMPCQPDMVEVLSARPVRFVRPREASEGKPSPRVVRTTGTHRELMHVKALLASARMRLSNAVRVRHHLPETGAPSRIP